MPIESAEDLAAFFNPEEFGEVVGYSSGGIYSIDDVEHSFGVLWDRPTDELPVGSTRVPVETNMIRFPAATAPVPETGAEIVVVRTGERFTIIGEPQLNRTGDMWACELAPIA